MCLIVGKEKCKKLIAETDIVVYKVFTKIEDDKVAISPFQYFHYIFDKLYQTEISFGDDYCCWDDIECVYLDKTYGDTCNDEGWRSFWRNPDPATNPTVSIENGFHSVMNLDRIRKSIISHGECDMILECIIPAGSEYYLGDLGDICVSNKIIVKNIQHELEPEMEKTGESSSN